MADSFLTKWERVIKAEPLNGYVMEPTRGWETQAAMIICGHDYAQRLAEGELAEFETFIREVLYTTAPRS